MDYWASWMNLLMFLVVVPEQSLQPTLIGRAFKFCSYERARRLRVAVIHGLARSAAVMASTYKAYLGVGLGPLSVGYFGYYPITKIIT